MHPKLTIRKALEQYRGDDLYRARSAWRGLSPEEMNKKYGQSGKTRAEILAGYEAHSDEVDAALRWLDTTR